MKKIFSIICLLIFVIISGNTLSFAQDTDSNDFIPPVILHPDTETKPASTQNTNNAEEPSDWTMTDKKEAQNNALPAPVELPADLSLQGKLARTFNINWNGEIITPSNNSLKAKLFMKDDNLYISISNKEYICNDINISEDKTITFYVHPEDNPNLKLSFEGQTENNNKITGKITDTKGKEGSWILYKTPLQNWYYKESYGDYIDTTEKALAKHDITLKDYHFKHFPIKYFVQTKNNTWEETIDSAMNTINKYLPLTKTANKNNADITIEVITNPAQLSKLCNTDIKSYTGCGGLTNNYGKISGEVYLSSNTFKSLVAQGIIIHEVFHALGVIGHSRDSRDLMHPYGNNESWEGSNTIKVNGYSMSLIKANEPRERDLNTLWLLYSQW